MTREEFIKQRCEIDKITEEEFEKRYRVVKCNCEKLEKLQQENKKQEEVINNFLDIVDKSKMLLNNPDLLDLYLKIKEVK